MRSSSCTSSSPSVSSHDVPASIVVVAVIRRALFDTEIVDSIRNLVLPILVAGDRDEVVLDGKSTRIVVGDVQACDTREDSGSIIHSMKSAENDDVVIMLLVPSSRYYSTICARWGSTAFGCVDGEWRILYGSSLTCVSVCVGQDKIRGVGEARRSRLSLSVSCPTNHQQNPACLYRTTYLSIKSMSIGEELPTMTPTRPHARPFLFVACVLLLRRLSSRPDNRGPPFWYCSAFQGATTPTTGTTVARGASAGREKHFHRHRRRQQHQQRSWSSSSINIQSRRRRSCIIIPCGRRDGDNDDDGQEENKSNKNESKRPVNNLDIFGQPKNEQPNKKNTTKKNSFFHDSDDVEIYGSDRIKSCIPYILPLIDGDTFGKYIYERIPPLGDLDYLLLRPLVESVQATPILGIVLFTTFALGPRFVNLSRNVRFNAQQAVLLDLCLILPTLLGDTIAEADGALHLSRSILEPSSNFVWYANVSMVTYCITWILRGKQPYDIPFISAAADYAIGPF